MSDNANVHPDTSGEGDFKIQPHPAKSNFPGSDAEATSGLGGAPNLQHLHQQEAAGATQARQPHVVAKDVADKLEQPKSREELQALGKKLNE